MLKKLLELIPREQEKLNKEAQKQADKEKLLITIITNIRNSLDINDLKHKIVTEIGKALDADKCGIFEYDSNSKKFFTLDEHSQYLSSEETFDYTGINLEEEELQPFRDEFLSGKDLYLPDTGNLPKGTHFFMRKFYKDTGIKSNYTVRITHHGELLGILYLNYFKQKRDLLKEDPNLLKILSDQAGIALYQARLYAQTKKLAERESHLRKITEVVRNSLEINEIIDSVCKAIPEIFAVQRVVITDFIKDDDGKFHSSYYNVHKGIKSSSDLPPSEQEKVYGYARKLIIGKYNNLIINNILESDAPESYKKIVHKLGIKSVLGVPIKEERKSWGGLFIIDCNSYRRWSDEEITLLEAIANKISIAIRQAELFGKTKKLAQREALVRKVTETIRNTLSIDEVKQKFVEEIGKTFKADRCFIGKYDFENKCFYPIEDCAEYLSSTKNKSCVGYTYYDEMAGYFYEAHKHDNPTINPDIEETIKKTEPNNIGLKKFAKDWNIKSNYGFSIVVDNEVVGGFALHYTRNKVKLDNEDIELLKLLANQAGIAIKQAELYSQTKKQAEREAFLREIIETVGGSIELEAVLNAICAKVFELFKPDRVSIENYPNKGDYKNWTVTNQHTSGSDILGVNDIEYPEKSKEYLGNRILEDGTDIIFDDIKKSDLPDFFVATNKKMGIKSYIAVPLKRDNDKWGVLALSQVHNYRKWTKSEIQLLHTVADQACIAIRQAELYEKSQEATILKSEFIANISHEIRTPLNSILGFSQLIDNPDCTIEKQRKYVNNISTSANYLLKLVNSILDFSKIESGKMDLFPEKFNSAEIIEETLSSVKSMTIQKNIRINAELSEIILDADVMKFKQIILNLLSNAIKFTNEGGKIIIRTKLKKNNLIVEVEDNGIGIAEADKAKIFNYFRQIDSSHSRNQEGTGLGLVLAKKLVELHEGTIGFESKEDKGSKFWFSLPKAAKF
jgi:GAF domain-containing protein